MTKNESDDPRGTVAFRVPLTGFSASSRLSPVLAEAKEGGGRYEYLRVLPSDAAAHAACVPGGQQPLIPT